MAIQFNCPYCTVTIQVPDQSAGKKGTCPQCGTKVVVPTPKNAPPPPPVEAAPAAPAFVPPASVPVFAPNMMPPQMPFAPQPTTAPPGFPQAPGLPFGFDPQQQAASQGYPGNTGFAPMPAFAPPPLAPTQDEPPSVAKTYKKKLKRRSGPAIWGPIVAVLVIAAGLAIYFLKPGVKPDLLSGKLTGTRLAKGKLQPALVHREWIDGIDEETLANVLKQMEKRTIKFRSSNELINMTFQGSPEGIKVIAAAGPSAELIAVDLTSNKSLDKWHQKARG